MTPTAVKVALDDANGIERKKNNWWFKIIKLMVVMKNHQL